MNKEKRIISFDGQKKTVDYEKEGRANRSINPAAKEYKKNH